MRIDDDDDDDDDDDRRRRRKLRKGRTRRCQMVLDYDR